MYVHLCAHTQSQNGYYDLINMKSLKKSITCSYVCVCMNIHMHVCVRIYLLDFLGQSKFQRLWVIFTTNTLLLVISSALIWGYENMGPYLPCQHWEVLSACTAALEKVTFSTASRRKITCIYFTSLASSHNHHSSHPEKKSCIQFLLKNGREVNWTFYCHPNPLCQDT